MTHDRRLGRTAVAATAALTLALLALPAPALGAEVGYDPPQKKYLIDVRLGDLDQIGKLAAAGFDVAGVDRGSMTAGVVATEDDLLRLVDLGWTYAIRDERLPGETSLALSDYTDPQELSAFMDQVQANYPNIAKKVLLQGTLFEGQKVWAMKITKDVALDHDRPAFVFDAQHHAREVMTPEIARDMIDYLTSRYATDAGVRRWVDNIEIWVVGSVNPDGAMYVFQVDNWWRRNRNPVCPADNNRNYRFLWNGCNGSSGSCSSDTYRGPSPESEPESQALAALVEARRPFFSLSYHSYGEYLMYSYGCSDPDEKAALHEVALGLNAILPNDAGATGQYLTGPIWSTIYPADGNSVDVQYGTFGVYAYIIEVNASSFQPDYATWRNVTVQRQRTAWQYFLNKTLDGPQIRGRVTDASSGAPLPATISVQEVTFTHGESPRTADASGRYHWLARAGQTYHVTYAMPGYCPETRTVVVGSGPATVDVALGRPDAPQGVTATANGDNRIDVAWTGVAGATEYRVYRSLTAGGPYDLAGTVSSPQTSFSDTPVSGSVTWHYVVRAFAACESPDSPEATASAGGPCTLGPAFAGLASVSDTESATCALTLAWPAATGRCGGPITYAVHRSPTAPFTPSAANLVASGLAGTTFQDHAALASGATYHYVVRAWDAGSNVSDANVLTRSAVPTGPRVSGTWSDGAGDSGAAQLVGTAPWSVLPAGGKTGPKVYATGTYTNNICATLTTPAIRLQAGAALSFASKYDIETDWDLGIVEIATGPAFSSWTKVATVNYPDDLVNSGNACGLPTSGAGTVFSRTYGTPAYAALDYTGSLGAWAGQDVKLRFRFGSDEGVTGQGWWVDDIRVTNALIPGTCAPGSPADPLEASGPAAPLTARRAAGGTSVETSYAPACGAIDNVIYWGTGPIAGNVAWSASACGLGNTGRAVFDPGDPAPGTFLYFVVVGQNGTNEGSYGRNSGAVERPEAAGLGSCDKPLSLGGACP